MKFNRQMRRQLEKQEKIRVSVDTEARGRILNLEREVAMIKSVMQREWPRYFAPPQTKGGVVLPTGADLKEVSKP